MRFSTLPEFEKRLGGFIFFVNDSNVKFKLLSALLEDDEPTPRVAKVLARACGVIQNQNYKAGDDGFQCMLSFIEYLFNVTTPEELQIVGLGELRLVHIDNFILDEARHDTDWEIELTKDIQGQGLLNPIVGIQVPGSGRVKVFDGNLRVKACHLLGMQKLPTYVFPYGVQLKKCQPTQESSREKQ